jgi:hypothetical protein
MAAMGRNTHLPADLSRRTSAESQEADLRRSVTVFEGPAGAKVRTAFVDMKYTECAIPPSNGGGFRLDEEKAK